MVKFIPKKTTQEDFDTRDTNFKLNDGKTPQELAKIWRSKGIWCTGDLEKAREWANSLGSVYTKTKLDKWFDKYNDEEVILID